MNRDVRVVFISLILLILTSLSPLLNPIENELIEEDGSEKRFEIINVDPNQLHNLEVVNHNQVEIKERAPEAWTRIGIFNSNEFIPTVEIPEILSEFRTDLKLVIVDGKIPLNNARENLNEIEGITIREYIWPSGYIVQGPISSLDEIKNIEEIKAIHDIPIALILGDVILELLNQNEEENIEEILLRIDGWRRADSNGFYENIEVMGANGDILFSDLPKTLELSLEEIIKWDLGRFDGKTSTSNLVNLLSNPGVAWIRISPEFTIFNDNSRTHMKWSTVTSYFPTNGLNGSGQLIAVADTGIDHDHGDFGNRIDAKIDVVNDGGKTGDKWSGHGTHVACTVLGDGTQGGYAGVAPQAELYFQAMEDDDNGNFYSPSITQLLGNAYSAGARIHSNSWGSFGSAAQGAYTSESEDVDDKANTYDRYYNGYQGLSIVFAAGNDGPNSGTVSSPSTAKNPITVGMHQSRYGSAPNTIMSGSSRGPTDDDRIKPDILAPGGYVRSCKSQEATDSSGSTWENQYYMEYTGTSMATPNAAGAAALVREYLTEVAQRASPQGALMKAILILGAQDIGTRDIPNNNEGWGRINLQNSIAPTGGRGIWVDDRSTLSNSGTSLEYNINVTSPGSPFKVVLAWSDHMGSRFSSKQLVNDLNLEVEAPDGTIYLGNMFQNGRSVTGGTSDDTNNVEVVLVDNAQTGLWKITVADVQHGGPRSQMFAIAASGVGINDLRPDVVPTPGSLITSNPIPNVGEEVQLSYEIRNIGNTEANNFDVELKVDGASVDSYELSLGTGAKTVLTWDWTPDSSGVKEISIHADSNDDLEETDEINNIYYDTIQVTTPGISLSSGMSVIEWTDANDDLAIWSVNLTNTAFISTNTTIESNSPIQRNTLLSKQWSVSLSSTSHYLQGQETTEVFVSVSIPPLEFPPEPGYYDIEISGKDIDNNILETFIISLYVDNLPYAIMSASDQVLVSPISPTIFDLKFINGGNSVQGYDLIINSPQYWQANFEEYDSNNFDSGLLSISEEINIPIEIFPPVSLIPAGTILELNILAISQNNPNQMWNKSINLVVGTYEMINPISNMSIEQVMPDERLNLSFKLINSGNSIASVTVDAIMPSGWIVLTYTKFFEIQPNSYADVIIPIQGNGQAESGTYKLIMSTLQGSTFEWFGELDVLYLPEPSIEFLDYQYSNGTEIDLENGQKLPIGISFNMRWVISNEGDRDFNPNIILETNNRWETNCEQIGIVEPALIKIATCEIIIPNTISAGTIEQLDFSLNFEDNYQINHLSNLTVPQEFKLDWFDVSIPLMEYNVIKDVEFEVTNLGNEKISDKLDIIVPEGWVAKIKDTNWIVLDAGESKRVVIELTPMDVGTFEITFELQNNKEIIGGSAKFNVISNGNEEYNAILKSEGSNGGMLIIGLLILIIAGIGVAAYGIPKNNPFNKKQISNLPDLPALPPLPNQINPSIGMPQVPPIFPKANNNKSELTPQAKEKMEEYIKQLISTGYPEEKAREHAMKHKEKFLKL
ncbi:MAG: Serine protease AprX [Methanobacteriota archaeon]|nr:MAG: Serine protease AprX [Euryarchaeota archaeon]